MIYPYNGIICVFSYYKREFQMVWWQRQLKIPELKIMGPKTTIGWSMGRPSPIDNSR